MIPMYFLDPHLICNVFEWGIKHGLRIAYSALVFRRPVVPTQKATIKRLLLLGGVGCLGLFGATELLGTVLPLLPQFTRRLFNLGRQPGANQPVLWLKLFLRRLVVVDQGKAGTPSTTKLCPEAKGDDTAFVGLVEGCEFLGQVCLGDVWTRGMEDIDDKLATGQETVGDEFAGAQGNGC